MLTKHKLTTTPTANNSLSNRLGNAQINATVPFVGDAQVVDVLG